MGGFLKKIKDKIEDIREHGGEKHEEQPQPQTSAAPAQASGSSQSAGRVESTIEDITKRAGSAGAESARAESTSASAPASSEATSGPEGKVAGSGLGRSYTTRAGDTLEAIAAYFYGDPKHKQRLIDDNAWLRPYDGKELPADMEIKVSEDASRGDAISS